MVNIDTVYQKVLAFANKEQRGYITPQEFNLFADQAQKEIFEQYFYDLNQFARLPAGSGEYSDITRNINEKIAMFEDSDTGTTLATDLYRLGTVIFNGREVEEVQQDEFLYINKSPLTKPTGTRRVYVRVAGNEIDLHPSGGSNNVEYTYIRIPSKPSWGYFVVGDKALYDSSASKTTHFELHPSEETELVYRILKYAGLSMRRDDIARGGQGLESLQVQQEKQ
tara:strand:+ start:206 stop:877 length:672 start_codon:yes stop_codon:yes gene_type:complete